MTVTMKLVLEASVRNPPRHAASMQPESGRLVGSTGWDHFGLVAILAPKRMTISAARGKADHLMHQGLLL